MENGSRKSGGLSIFPNLPGIVTPLFPLEGTGVWFLKTGSHKREEGGRIKACMMWKAFNGYNFETLKR